MAAMPLPIWPDLPTPTELPVHPGICVVVGIALAGVGGLIENALHLFSPALLHMRLEKDRGEDENGSLEQLEKELQDAEIYLPSTVLIKFAGLGLALLGALGLWDGALFWPPGWIGLATLFVVTVVVCGMLPHRITEHRAEAIVFRTLPVLRVLRILFLPITAPTAHLVSFVVRNLLGIRQEYEQANNREQLADEIRAAVEDSDEREQLAEVEKEWIENIVEFRTECASGIMTPRTDMVCAEASLSFREAVQLAVQAGHSRLPVFEQKMDNVVGIFYLRDAVAMMADSAAEVLDSPVRESARPAYFVPESKKVSDLLHEFKARRVQIAIVVDEYGGTAGLVSIEDILEEIVGEIEDEYDPERESPMVILEGGRAAEVSAKVRIGDLNEEIEANLPESEDYETVGGFVFSQLGRVPASGEGFQYQNVEITIVNASDRKVERVRVRVLETA